MVVVGIGLSSRATADDVAAVVADALGRAGLGPDEVASAATLETRLGHPALRTLPWPVVGIDRARIERTGADCDPRPEHPPVAEQAALLAAGPGAALLVPRVTGTRATAAVAAVAPDHDQPGDRDRGSW